jgi:hypothetical protein
MRLRRVSSLRCVFFGFSKISTNACFLNTGRLHPTRRRGTRGASKRVPSLPPSHPFSLPSNEKTRNSGRVKTRPESPSFHPPFLPSNERRWGTRDASKRIPSLPPSHPFSLPSNEKTRDSGRVKTRPEPPSFPSFLPPFKWEDEGRNESTIRAQTMLQHRLGPRYFFFLSSWTNNFYFNSFTPSPLLGGGDIYFR